MANFNDFKSWLAILAFFVILACASLGYYGYKQYVIIDPLQDSITAIDGVDNIEIQKIDKSFLVKTHISGIKDLQSTYYLIKNQLNSQLSDADYQLVFNDSRCTKLQDFYVRLQPFIYEAIAGNKYVWLSQELESLSRANGISAKISIDDEHVFLELIDEDSALYEVFSRK